MTVHFLFLCRFLAQIPVPVYKTKAKSQTFSPSRVPAVSQLLFRLELPLSHDFGSHMLECFFVSQLTNEGQVEDLKGMHPLVRTERV